MVVSSEVIVSRQKSKSSRRGKGYVQKPKSNIYTMLLILSFLMLSGACGFLYLHLDKYDFQMKPDLTGAATGL